MTTSTTTRQAINSLFSAIGNGAAPHELAARFTEDVDWRIPGDANAAPWIAQRQGRAGVAAFFADLLQYVQPQRFEVHRLLVDGEYAVAIGHLVTTVKATGLLIDSEFAIDIAVQDGLIRRYHLLEDSLAVYRAARGAA